VACWSKFKCFRNLKPFGRGCSPKLAGTKQLVLYIVLRYNSDVAAKITREEYRALAELRFRIRRFVQEGDAAAREAGLEPQQYLLLLTIHGLPEEGSIRTLADRLSLQHHSTVELVDRMEEHGYVKRVPDRKDRRQVLVRLEPLGEKLLARVAAKRIIELRANGKQLVAAIGALLEKRAKKSSRRKKKRTGVGKSKRLGRAR
jgi:DNA-binding MarR family transcriptional regulator